MSMVAAKGLTRQEIADELKLSQHSVTEYIKRGFDMLHVRNLLSAVSVAIRRGLLDLSCGLEGRCAGGENWREAKGWQNHLQQNDEEPGWELAEGLEGREGREDLGRGETTKGTRVHESEEQANEMHCNVTIRVSMRMRWPLAFHGRGRSQTDPTGRVPLFGDNPHFPALRSGPSSLYSSQKVSR